MAVTPLPLSEAHVAGDSTGHVQIHNDLAHYINVSSLAINATTVSTSTTLSSGFHTLVSTTASTITATLPAAPAALSFISVEKSTSDNNLVTVSGSIHGVASTLSLALQRESIQFVADANNSWWPVGGHKTLGSLDARYSYRDEQSRLIGMTFDPAIGDDQGMTITAGKVYMFKVDIEAPKTITNIELPIYIAGTGGTALANCFVGVYSPALGRLGLSVDQSASWATGGVKTIALTAPAVVATENAFVYVSLLVGTQSSTPLQLIKSSRLGNATYLNWPESTGVFRAAFADTGATALPATAAALTASPDLLLVGVS